MDLAQYSESNFRSVARRTGAHDKDVEIALVPLVAPGTGTEDVYLFNEESIFD